MEQMRRYPVGIQTFSDIIVGGYTYVDKTGLMWKMQHLAKYAFLSRPRRFGKSLLSSTIHSFFDGDRRLFEGLKVMEFEKDWKKHPVIHLDLSQAKGMKSVKELRDRICMLLRDYTAIYGDDPLETMPGSMLKGIMQRAYHQTGLYWFVSCTPKFLIYQMQHFRTDITEVDNLELPSTAFDRPTEAMTTALPLLYQSGYLTIKDYDKEADIYLLSIPNKEVRIGYTEGLLPTYIGIESYMVQTGFAVRFWRALKKDDINLAFEEMRAYLASLPYVEGFKKKLSEVSNAEGFYEWSLYLIFSMLNVYVRTQVKCAGGRADMVVHMPDAIYVVELKINGTAQEALDQINSRRYAIPYSTSGKKVVKVGVSFSMETKTIEDWIIAE